MVDSCNIRAALQILQTGARASQNVQTTMEIRSLVALGADVQELECSKEQSSAVKQVALRFSPLTANLIMRRRGGSYWRLNPGTVGGAVQILRPSGVQKVGLLCCASGLAFGPRRRYSHLTARLWTAATIAPLDRGPRSPSQVSKCRSPAHGNCNALRWLRC